MAYVNEFSGQLILPQYQQTNYGTELQTKLLGLRQSKYNEALSRLNSLKSQALNITMINELGRQKLDNYNKEISERLQGDLGDLSDKKVQSNLANTFSKISNDTDLLERSKLSQWYLGEQSKVDKMKMDKDPTKSGYDAINEYVFKNWDGGYNDFVNSGDITRFKTQREGYVPFRDVKQKLVNLTKLLHAEKKTTLASKDGRLLYTTEEGVSPERIRQLLSENLGQDELSQLDILSKYRMLSNSTPEADANLFKAYDGFISKETKNVQSQLEIARANINQYDPSKIDSKDPQRDEKLARYSQIYNSNVAYATQLENKLKQGTQNRLTPIEWSKKSRVEKLPYIKQMMYENQVNSISEALSWKNEIQKVESDQAYWNAYKINLQQDMFKHKMKVDADKSNIAWAGLELDRQELSVKALKENGKTGDKDFTPSGAGFTTPTPMGLIEGYDKMNDDANKMLAKGINLVETATLQQLGDNDWLKNNSENHFVKLWGDFKLSHPNGTKEEFNVYFKKITEEGVDDPYTNQVLDGLKRDKELANIYLGQIQKVNEVAYGARTAYQTKFGNNSVEDYARLSGWTPQQGEMYFNLPDENGTVRRFTQKEVQQKLDNTTPIYGTSTTGSIRSGTENLTPQTIRNFTIDNGFIQVFNAAEKLKNQKLGQVKKVFDERIGDFFQSRLVPYGKEKGSGMIRSQVGSINQSLRQAGEFTVSDNMIESVFVPETVGDRGSFLLTKIAVDDIKKNNPKAIFQTSSGTKTGEEITINDQILYDYSNPRAYDLALIKGYELNGSFRDSYKGYDITFTKDPTTEAGSYTITKGGKTVMNPSKFPPGTPIDQILNLSRAAIDKVRQ